MQGVSPALSRELCALAGITPQDPASTPAVDWQALHAQWHTWLARLAQGMALVTFPGIACIAAHVCLCPDVSIFVCVCGCSEASLKPTWSAAVPSCFRGT